MRISRNFLISLIGKTVHGNIQELHMYVHNRHDNFTAVGNVFGMVCSTLYVICIGIVITKIANTHM